MHDLKPFFYTLEASRPIALEKDTYFEQNSAAQSLQQGFQHTRDALGCDYHYFYVKYCSRHFVVIWKTLILVTKSVKQYGHL